MLPIASAAHITCARGVRKHSLTLTLQELQFIERHSPTSPLSSLGAVYTSHSVSNLSPVSLKLRFTNPILPAFLFQSGFGYKIRLMSRVTTRKRTAPGTEPMQVQQLQTPSQISSDQFAQWSPQVMSQQIPGHNSHLNNYGQQVYGGATDRNASGPTSQSQLSRMPARNQLATRQESSGAWRDASLTPTQESTNLGVGGGDELDRRAEIAKQEMQANRKQIPPFVQKLSRQVSVDGSLGGN